VEERVIMADYSPDEISREEVDVDERLEELKRRMGKE